MSRHTIVTLLCVALSGCLAPAMAGEHRRTDSPDGANNYTPPRHPDIVAGRPYPPWAHPINMAEVWLDIQILMNLFDGRNYNPQVPWIRFWSNIPPEHHKACPDCTPERNYFVESRNELWFADDQGFEDVLDMIIQHFQITGRGLDPDTLDSSFAVNERKFFIQRYWEDRPSIHPYVWGDF